MPTKNYTLKELYGPGTSSITLTAGTPYTFTIVNQSGSSYFTMETKFNYLFDGSTPKNMSGSFSSTGSIKPIVSNYIASFAVPKTSSYSFVFRPATNVSGNTLKLRGTDGITVSVSY